jgi:single-stranded DNA-specific DHH superfamily exonuclease
MALDELHARRLATVASILESAFDRVGLILNTIEESQENTGSSIKAEQIQQAREKMRELREMLHQALERFSIRVTGPEPRQMLAAELSALWVVLENARPERMKGYGRQFAPADRERWEELIRALLQGLEELREITREGRDPY